MAVNIPILRGPPKYAQIGIFGLKRNHLATLFQTTAKSIFFLNNRFFK
jgi:hypothetical protein